MAVGVLATPSSSSEEYNSRMTTFVVLSCMVAATGGLIFGYDIGISGGVTSMEPFLKKFFPDVYRNMKEDADVSNYCIFDSQLLQLFTSSLYVAGFISSLFASSFTKSYGRKPSIVVGGFTFLAGSVLSGAAVNVYMLILGRLLLGFGVGFANQAVPLYLSEMAPPRRRGAVTNGFHFSLGLGVLTANLINYASQKIKAGWGWRLSLSMAAIPALILTAGAIFLPETPNSLIQQSHDQGKAHSMLQRIRGTEDVQAELDDLTRANDASKSIKHPFRTILQKKYRPQLVVAIAFPFFQQVTGINVIGFYAPVLFRTIGLGESASLMSTVVTGVIGASFTFVSMLLVDKLGRRVLLVGGGIQMLVSQVIVGGVMAAHLGEHGQMGRGYALVVIVFVFVYVSGFCLSWGPLGWLIPSEIFPLEIRSVGQSVNIGVSFVFIFVVAQAFLSMLCRFKAGIFFFFGGWVAVMTVFAYLFLPETKNVPIEQIDGIWKEHWFWKRIVGQDCDIRKTGENESNARTV